MKYDVMCRASYARSDAHTYSSFKLEKKMLKIHTPANASPRFAGFDVRLTVDTTDACSVEKK